MPLDLTNLGEVALWRYDKRNGSPQFDSDKVEDDDVAYTALPAATFEALVAEVEAARKALSLPAPREATPVAWGVFNKNDRIASLFADESGATEDAKFLNKSTPIDADYSPYRVLPLVRAPGATS